MHDIKFIRNNPEKFELKPTVEGYTKKSEILGTIIPMYEGFSMANDSLYNTTEASERIDAAAGIVSNAEDLLDWDMCVRVS